MSPVSTPLPPTLALIDDDPEYAEFLAQYLREQGCAVTRFADSDDFLVSDGAYGYDFYLVDLTLPGVDGLALVRLLRKRTQAGIIVVSGRTGPDVFDAVLSAGADMYLAKPLRFDQVALAVRSVRRRTVASGPALPRTWRVERQARRLVTPDGVAIDLSDTDLQVFGMFVEANGAVVPREALFRRLGREPDGEAENWLHATIYRLRRRIERATTEVVPLQSVPRTGYVFRGALEQIDQN